MSENLNNPNSISERETLPANEEVRADFHMSNLISLEEMVQKREADRLAEEANPTKVEIAPTPEKVIGRQGLILFMTRRNTAGATPPHTLDNLKDAA